MTWRIVEDVPSVPASGKYYRQPSTIGYKEHRQAESTTPLCVWRCDGCGARACGRTGQDPGLCLKKGCRFAEPAGRSARR